MGSYVENKITGTSAFIDNMRSMLDNTLNFENCSLKEYYKSDNESYLKETEKNLVYFRNILQEKYLSRIMLKRKQTTITDEQRLSFDMNPYLASSVLLGNADYWWILLLVNKKMNVEKFTKLGSFIYTPNMDDIKECLTKELSKNEKLGEIE